MIFFFLHNTFAGIIEVPRKTRVLAAGDVMFDWGLRETMKTKGFYSPILGLKSLFETADIRMVNLETPVTSGNLEPDKIKSYVFNAKPEELGLLEFLEVDHVFLANNHSMDYGKEGLEETMKILNEKSIGFSGAGANLDSAYSTRTIQRRDLKLEITSVSAIGENRLFATRSNPGAAPYSLKKLVTFPGSKEESVSLLSVHWGVEYSPEPTAQQVRDAHKLIDSGFKIIIGHHPHIPQGIEKYGNGVIFYSMGNFIFGSKNQYLNHNLMAIFHFEGNRLIYCEVIPVFGKFQNSQHIIHPLEGEEADSFLKEIAYLSQKLDTKLTLKNNRAYLFFED